MCPRRATIESNLVRGVTNTKNEAFDFSQHLWPPCTKLTCSRAARISGTYLHKAAKTTRTKKEKSDQWNIDITFTSYGHPDLQRSVDLAE